LALRAPESALEGPGSVRSLSFVRHDFGNAGNRRENVVGRLLIRPVLGPFLFPVAIKFVSGLATQSDWRNQILALFTGRC